MLCSQVVPDRAQPIFTLREDRMSAVTESWKQWYEDREVDEWLMSVGSVIDQGWNEQCVLPVHNLRCDSL